MPEANAIIAALGPAGAILIVAGGAFRLIWPDVRDWLRAQSAAFKALAELAERTDQRLANIERTTAATNEGVAVLLDRERPRVREAGAKRPATEGAR
jgi:hypothetical protein